MPTKRQYENSVRYYVKRQFDGIGQVYRSLHTDRKGVARRREEALLNAHRRGHLDIVRAFDEGDVDIARILEAHETGTLDALAREIQREERPLEEAVEAALADKSPDVKESTLNRYRTGLDHFEAFIGEERPLRDALTTDHVQQFKSHRLETDEVARETINNDLTALQVLATYAERKDWIDERPEIKKYSSRVRISYLESKEIAAYMAAVRRTFRPLFQLLIGTGMRLGEAEGLTVSDLRLGEGENRAMIEDAKSTAGVRSVFVPEWVADTLTDHLARHERAGTDEVFQIPRRTVQKEHDGARKQLGKPGYTIHDHRHTAAVHLARAGLPLHLLQQQLGHSNVDQTMRYARFHPDYGDVQEYFGRVEEELSGTKSQMQSQRSVASTVSEACGR